MQSAHRKHAAILAAQCLADLLLAAHDIAGEHILHTDVLTPRAVAHGRNRATQLLCLLGRC